MMVWENVLSARLRNMNSDSLNRESVYSNSMVAKMSSLLANTHTHIHTLSFFITMVRIFHLHLLIVTPKMPKPKTGKLVYHQNP